MSGIHVLSNILKGGNKLEKTSPPKEKDVSDSPENVAAVFAAMFSGFMNSNVDSKGQNSKAGQESEEKQSAGNPVQSLQNPNGQGSMLGYGNFALSNLFQPMLQSDLPAGKEANSGNDVSRGTGGLATANEAMLNLVSLASDEVSAQSGMTTPKPQGDNPTITELDKYRQVIANLLVALSGEITNTSLKGNRLSSEGVGTMDLRQEMTKIVQGWMTVTDEDAKNAFALRGNVTGGQAQTKGEVEGAKTLQGGNEIRDNSSSTQMIGRLEALVKEIRESTSPSPKVNPLSSESSGPKVTRQDMAKIVEGWMKVTDNPALNAKAATLLAALNPFLRQGAEDAKAPQGMNQMIEVEGGILAPEAKGSLESFMKPLNGTDLDLVARQMKDTAFLTNVLQKSDVMGPQGSKTSKIFQGVFREEVQKGDSMQSTELSGVKDIKNQNSSAGLGVASNLVAVNVADGKTVAVPVWEQISTVVREQVMDRRQALKELDIQLHPVDLGKIQIGMRWENGQVHLVVRASEVATGQLLQNQLSDLRQNLTDQGVNCGMLQMGQGGERQQNPHGDESQRTLNQNTDPNEGEDQNSVSDSLSLGQDRINRINVTA